MFRFVLQSAIRTSARKINENDDSPRWKKKKRFFSHRVVRLVNDVMKMLFVIRRVADLVQTQTERTPVCSPGQCVGLVNDAKRTGRRRRDVAKTFFKGRAQGETRHVGSICMERNRLGRVAALDNEQIRWCVVISIFNVEKDR